MAKPTKCSFPGCTNDSNRSRFCAGHRQLKSVLDGLHCQICGFGPRSSLVKHVIAFHDGTAAYKERFGRDTLVSENMRVNMRALLADQIGQGKALTKARRQRTCRRGHRLVGENVITTHHRNGEIHRQCRTCRNEAVRQKWYARHGWRRRRRKCHWCGDSYLATRPQQRFCCPECRVSARNR